MNKINRNIVTVTVVSVLLSQSVIPVFAQNLGGQRLIHDVNNMQNQASHAAQMHQNELQNIIKRSDVLIANRITALNTLATRIQADTRLSTSEKSSLSTDIQTDITGLTTLKVKIDADTDATTARTDEKQIITNYYIYAMFEPKIDLLVVLSNLQAVTANLQALVPQIQNLITTLQTQGKNVSTLQSLLNDVSSQLQTITTTLTTDTNTIQNVTVTTVNSQATFTQVHQDIAQIVRSGFAKIRSDFAQMRPLFQQLISNTPITLSPTGGILVTPSPTIPVTSTSTP